MTSLSSTVSGKIANVERAELSGTEIRVCVCVCRNPFGLCPGDGTLTRLKPGYCQACAVLSSSGFFFFFFKFYVTNLWY